MLPLCEECCRGGDRWAGQGRLMEYGRLLARDLVLAERHAAGTPEVAPPCHMMWWFGDCERCRWPISGGPVSVRRKLDEKLMGGVLGRQAAMERSKEAGAWRVCMPWRGYNYGDAVDPGASIAGRGTPQRDG
eukprot:4017356-Amphidinium_carterae.1